MKVSHPTTAPKVRQCLGLGGYRDRGERPHEIVLREDEAASLACAAVGAREAAVSNEDGVAVVGAGRGTGQFNARYATVSQDFEFAGLADAVLVQVAPDASAGEGSVGRAEPTVVVAVEFAQRCEAVDCLLAACQHGLVAEELGTRIDRAVAVAVKHEQAVFGRGPSCCGAHRVVVRVEEDGWGQVERRYFQAISVQIENQGVDKADSLD